MCIRDSLSIERMRGYRARVGRRVQRDRHASAAKQRDVRARVADCGNLTHRMPVLCAPLFDKARLVVLIEIPANYAREDAIGYGHLGAADGREAMALTEHLGIEAPSDRAQQEPYASGVERLERLGHPSDPRSVLKNTPRLHHALVRKPCGGGVRHDAVGDLVCSERPLKL